MSERGGRTSYVTRSSSASLPHPLRSNTPASLSTSRLMVPFHLLQTELALERDPNSVRRPGYPAAEASLIRRRIWSAVTIAISVVRRGGRFQVATISSAIAGLSDEGGCAERSGMEDEEGS